MDPLDLLARPEWQALSPAELQQAIAAARRRGGQTWDLLLARHCEAKQSLPASGLELYLRHCVRPAPAGLALAERWDDRRIGDWCGDPRVCAFCTVYDRLWRGFHRLPPVPDDQGLLHTRLQQALAVLAWSQQVLQWQPGSTVAQVSYGQALGEALLATMRLNAHWVDRVA